MAPFPVAVRGHTLHHVTHWLGVHYVVEVVSHLDGSVAAQIAVGFCVGHLIMTGKGGYEQHDLLGYVFDAKHKIMSFACKYTNSFSIIVRFPR